MKACRQKRSTTATACLLASACIVLLVCTLSAAKAAGAAPGNIAGSVVLDGLINQAMVDRFNEAVSEDGITTVVITSLGGGSRESLQIAAGMQARNMDVVVRGLCLGPCAQFILVAGRNRRIEKGAWVGFHASVTGLVAVLGAVGDNAPEDFRPDLAAFRDAEAQESRIYQQGGVSTSLLVDAQSALQPRCIIFGRPEGEGRSANLSVTYAMWVPTRKYLASVGLEFEGYWPKSRKETSRNASRLLDDRGRNTSQVQRIRFGEEDHLRRRGQAPYSLKTLRACALEETE